jgi:uracil phosphoribosyltransferase
VSLHVVDHPIAHDALAQLRDAGIPPEQFRTLARRITLVLATEALRQLPMSAVTVRTPLANAPGQRIQGDVVLVPVLRAGLGMLDAVLDLLPAARIGHIGLQRDEQTAEASRYYAKLPPGLGNSLVLLLDPMLATGGSASDACDLLKNAGARQLSLVSIVAAPEGVALMESRHPDVRVYTPVVDKELNARKYIVPGLGDFGDRLYGTV